MEICPPLSGLFLLTKPQGLLITSQIAAMSSSDRLARVYGEIIPWSSTSFKATVWLKPSLRNISSISLTIVGARLSMVGMYLASNTVWTSSSSFYPLAPLGGSMFSSLLQLSPPGSSGTSCLSWSLLPPCDELARFALLVGLNLIPSTSYVEGAQAVVYQTTQAALAECYGQWYIFVVLNNLGMNSIINSICRAFCCLGKCNSQQNHLSPC